MARNSHQWTLRKVYAECRAAPVVWIALLDMATERGRAVVTPTRDVLVEATGITRLPTISAALTALESAGWIDRVHVPVYEGGRQTATTLRIIIRRRERKLCAMAGKTKRPRSERKSCATAEVTVANENRSKGSERKTFQDSLTGRGCPMSPPADAGAGSTPAPDPGEGQKPEEMIVIADIVAQLNWERGGSGGG